MPCWSRATSRSRSRGGRVPRCAASENRTRSKRQQRPRARPSIFFRARSSSTVVISITSSNNRRRGNSVRMRSVQVQFTIDDLAAGEAIATELLASPRCVRTDRRTDHEPLLVARFDQPRARVALRVQDDARSCRRRHRVRPRAHPYDVPEIVACDITAGLDAYIDWIVAETHEPTDTAVRRGRGSRDARREHRQTMVVRTEAGVEGPGTRDEGEVRHAVPRTLRRRPRDRTDAVDALQHRGFGRLIERERRRARDREANVEAGAACRAR